jgi:hypothetical protein
MAMEDHDVRQVGKEEEARRRKKPLGRGRRTTNSTDW